MITIMAVGEESCNIPTSHRGVRGLWKLYGHVPECFTYKTTWITTKLLVPIDVFVIIVTMILIDTNSNVTATN